MGEGAEWREGHAACCGSWDGSERRISVISQFVHCVHVQYRMREIVRVSGACCWSLFSWGTLIVDTAELPGLHSLVCCHVGAFCSCGIRVLFVKQQHAQGHRPCYLSLFMTTEAMKCLRGA